MLGPTSKESLILIKAERQVGPFILDWVVKDYRSIKVSTSFCLRKKIRRVGIEMHCSHSFIPHTFLRYLLYTRYYT